MKMVSIFQHGQYLGIMINKYSIPIEESSKKDMERLINQLWKLIPMCENGENWKKQLDTVIIEVAGLNELFISPSFIQLLSKLEGLRAQSDSIDFVTFRRVIFESINLLSELIKNG